MIIRTLSGTYTFSYRKHKTSKLKPFNSMCVCVHVCFTHSIHIKNQKIKAIKSQKISFCVYTFLYFTFRHFHYTIYFKFSVLSFFFSLNMCVCVCACVKFYLCREGFCSPFFYVLRFITLKLKANSGANLCVYSSYTERKKITLCFESISTFTLTCAYT